MRWKSERGERSVEKGASERVVMVLGKGRI